LHSAKIRQRFRQRRPTDYEWVDIVATTKNETEILRELQPGGSYKTLVQIKPQYAMGWFNYGLTLSFLGRYPEALACHDRALAVEELTATLDGLTGGALSRGGTAP
jgi:tetratricopeptide (TPR) repeat protein